MSLESEIDNLLGTEIGIYVRRQDSLAIFSDIGLNEEISEGYFLDQDAKPAKFFTYPANLGFNFKSCVYLSNGYIFEGELRTPVGNITDCRIFVLKEKVV